MSACIYHDAESVTICPSCDFAVCQQCVDGGEDGVCAECTASNANQAAAAQAEEVPRCKYCRIAADDETPIDHDGYCETCAALPRCATHSELIAFDACKSCRSQYCRKCLGFNNVCEACTARQAAAPRPKPAAPKPGATGPVKAGTGPVKSGTGPVKGGTGAIKKGTGPTGRPDAPRPKRPRPPGAAGPAKPGTGRKKPESELDEKGRPKKRPPTRGAAAIEAKMQQSQMGQRARMQLIAAVVVVGAIAMVLLSGWVMRANSTEESSKQVQAQMVEVHRAVVRFHKKHNRLPTNEDDIKRTLKTMAVPNAARYRISLEPGKPSSVVYQLSGEEGFMIMGVDGKGQLVQNSDGTPVTIDQYYDSGL